MKIRPVVPIPHGIEFSIELLIPFVMSIHDKALSYRADGAPAICGELAAVDDAVKTKFR